MEVLWPIFMILAIGEAVTETVRMIYKNTIQREHFISAGVVYLLLALTKTNILILFGLGANLATNNLYWEVSYVLVAFLGMRGAGVLHDLLKAASTLKESLASYVIKN